MLKKMVIASTSSLVSQGGQHSLSFSNRSQHVAHHCRVYQAEGLPSFTIAMQFSSVLNDMIFMHGHYYK